MKLPGFTLAIVLGITFTSFATAQEADRSERRRTSVAAGAAWEVLDKSMSDRDERHRQQAVLAGGVIGPNVEAVKFVAGALQDKSPLVRQTAVTVLGDLRIPEALPYLRHAMEDSAEVSFTAARVLCNRGEQDGCQFLQQVLIGDRKDPKPGFVQKNLKYAKKKLSPEELALMGVREASGVILGPAAIGIVVGEEARKRRPAARASRIPAAPSLPS